MAKKRHIVMPRTTRIQKEGIVTSKGKLSFKDKTMMYVGDDIADEIDQTQGLKGTGDVWVHEDPRLNWTERYKADGVHSFFFGATNRYADAWEAFEKRRKDGQRRHEAGIDDAGGASARGTKTKRQRRTSRRLDMETT